MLQIGDSLLGKYDPNAVFVSGDLLKKKKKKETKFPS